MITMHDVAEKAGVSRATVSFVLNGRGVDNRIPEETQQKVLGIAADLGYRRNELALATKIGRSRVLCFLADSPHLDADFKTRVLAGVLEEASNCGYAVKVQYLPEGGERIYRETIERCIGWRLAGMITLNLQHAETVAGLYEEMARYRIPVAVVEDIPPVKQGICVTSDTQQGVHLALDHLAQQGHRRIAFLSGNPDSPTAIWRESIFRRAMLDFGLNVPDGFVRYGDWWLPEPNERAAKQLLTQGGRERPTAILCAGDPIAMVVLNVARALQIQVPRDLSVVGQANYSLATYADPPLTTVAEPFQEMGAAVVRHLLTRLSNQGEAWDETPLHEMLPMRLVVRSSTAPPAREPDEN